MNPRFSFTEIVDDFMSDGEVFETSHNGRIDKQMLLRLKLVENSCKESDKFQGRSVEAEFTAKQKSLSI